MLILVDAKQISENDVMQFRKEFLEVGECSINGSRGLHNYDNYKEFHFHEENKVRTEIKNRLDRCTSAQSLW